MPTVAEPVLRRHRRRPSPLALAALLALGACPLAGWAQQNAPPARPRPIPGVPAAPAANAPAARPPANLAEALPKVDWDPAERGTLLVVAPEAAKARGGRRDPQPDGSVRYVPPPVLEPAGDEGYRLTVIDAHFERKLRQVGSVWAVVPETMTVLNSTRLPEPDPYLGMTREQKTRLFQSRLTAAQWKQIASPQGLGVGELDREQRALFLSTLPDPFRVQVSRQAPEGGARVETVTVSRSQLNGLRIAMRRQMTWAYNYENQPNHTILLGGGASAANPDGSPRLTLSYPYEDYEARRRKVMDVPLAEEVPNVLKEGDVHFAAGALDALIPVADAKTVGELVGRVAKAARVELYADPRYASLPVHARAAGGVRAGDVLQAICLSVTGTVRKVEAGGAAGFAYVLTDDREGLAVRHARIARWLRRANRVTDRREQEVAERLKAASPIEQVGWAEGDPLAPGAALRQKIEAHREAAREEARKPRVAGVPYDYNSRFPMVPVAELPPAARKMVEEQLASFRGGTVNGEPATLRTDAVRLDVRANTVYVVPGLGAVEAQSGIGGFGGGDSLFGAMQPQFAPPKPPEDDFTLPVPVPAQLTDRHLFVDANTPDEARRAAREAKARGMTALWLGAGAGDAKEFAARVAAAREAVPGLRVYAVVRALRPDGGKPVAGPADVNLFGETTSVTAARYAEELPEPVSDPRNPDYYRWYEVSRTLKVFRGGDFPRLDVPAARAAARARVLEIARTPGLAGLVLRDLVPPGYTPGQYGAFQEVQTGGPEFDLGYSPETRLAFLRAHGVDPIDLGVFADDRVFAGGRYGGMPATMILPFFRNYGAEARGRNYNGTSAIEMGAKDAGERWGRFRQQLAVEFQNDLFGTLGEVRGADGKPLALVREAGMPMSTGGAFVAWEKPLEMPAPPPGRPSERQPTPPRPQPFTGLAVISPETLTFGGRQEERDRPMADRLGLQVGRMRTTLERQARVPNANYRPGGLLIDLSGMPVDEALPALGQLRPPPPPPPAAGPPPKPGSAPTGARRAASGGGGSRR